MTKKINGGELVRIPLKREDLLFFKSFIDKLGGVENARIVLLDIVDRYFRWEYIDPNLMEE